MTSTTAAPSGPACPPDHAAQADGPAAPRPRRPPGGRHRRREHGRLPPRGPLRLQHRRPGHRGRAHRGGRPGSRHRHDHRRGRDRLLGPGRRRRARRARRRLVLATPPARPRLLATADRLGLRRASAPGPASATAMRRSPTSYLNRPGRCRPPLRRTHSGVSSAPRSPSWTWCTTRGHLRWPRPRRRPARPSRAATRCSGPARRPGGTDDRQARLPGSDARGRREDQPAAPLRDRTFRQSSRRIPASRVPVYQGTPELTR